MCKDKNNLRITAQHELAQLENCLLHAKEYWVEILQKVAEKIFLGILSENVFPEFRILLRVIQISIKNFPQICRKNS